MARTDEFNIQVQDAPSNLSIQMNDSSTNLGVQLQTGSSTVSKVVHTDTTEHWNAQPSLIAIKDHLYIYSDYDTINGAYVPAFKVGDGKAYLIDLPFVSGNNSRLSSHIEDTNIHITPEEREFWNNKVRCFISQGEDDTLVFTNN